ncbi:hypothetical protein [uncultured Sphingomonas sp.]|uniref:hypothetical protein n=1 Tax=uncultured Sphingomonas sp. TaxID=158754 RepID=UPI0035CAD78F
MTTTLPLIDFPFGARRAIAASAGGMDDFRIAQAGIGVLMARDSGDADPPDRRGIARRQVRCVVATAPVIVARHQDVIEGQFIASGGLPGAVFRPRRHAKGVAWL